MKVLYFFLGLVLLTLSACGGEPFGPEQLIGSEPTAGEAGQAVAVGAAGAPDAAAGAPDSIGVAGALSAAGASAANGGSTSVAGSSSGGPSAGSGGTAAVPPPEPPCSPATNVSSKVRMDLGTIAWCLKTTDDLNHIACTNWDTREVRVNAQVVRCGMKFTAGPRANDGYNYIQIESGKGDMASIDWSVI
jgi:hypothetical protein